MLSPITDATAGMAGQMCVPGTDPNPAFEHAMNNTVTIVAVKGDAVAHIGTGFFVAGTDGMTLGTVDHIAVHIANPQPGVEYYVKPCGGDLKGELIKVEVGARDPGNDLAVLTVESPTNYTGIETAPDGSAQLGEAVRVPGLTGKGAIRCALAGGTISAVEVDLMDNPYYDVPEENLIVLDITGHPGNSGSPVVDANGQLVGVLSGAEIKGGLEQVSVYIPLIGRWDILVGSKRVGIGVLYAIKSEEFAVLVERHQASGAISEANESAVEVEEGLLPLLPDIDDAEGTRQFLIESLQQYDDPGAAVLRDALLQEGDMSGVDLRDALLREGEIAAVLRDALLREGDMGSLVEELPDINDVDLLLPQELGMSREAAARIEAEAARLEAMWAELTEGQEGLSSSTVNYVRELLVGNALADQLEGPAGQNELPGTGGPLGGGGIDATEPDVPDLDLPLPG